MGRKLNTYVLVGETVYEPGTDEADIDGKITADVWASTGEGQDEAPSTGEGQDEEATSSAAAKSSTRRNGKS